MQISLAIFYGSDFLPFSDQNWNIFWYSNEQFLLGCTKSANTVIYFVTSDFLGQPRLTRMSDSARAAVMPTFVSPTQMREDVEGHEREMANLLHDGQPSKKRF